MDAAAKGVKTNYVGEYAGMIPDFLKTGAASDIDLSFEPNDTYSLRSILDKTNQPEGDHGGHGDGHGKKPDNPVVSGIKRMLLGFGALAGVHYGIYPFVKTLATKAKGLGTALGLGGLVLQGLGIFGVVTGFMKIFDKNGNSSGGGH